MFRVLTIWFWITGWGGLSPALGLPRLSVVLCVGLGHHFPSPHQHVSWYCPKNFFFKKPTTHFKPGMVVHTFIPVLGRQRHTDICVLVANLVYTVRYCLKHKQMKKPHILSFDYFCLCACECVCVVLASFISTYTSSGHLRGGNFKNPSP